MSFVSNHFKRYSIGKYAIISLIDSEFGEVEFEADFSPAGVMCGIAKVYIERNLPVGKNIALTIIYWHKLNGDSIQEYVDIHDNDCPKIIPNWFQYAKERDEHLEKLLPLL